MITARETSGDWVKFTMNVQTIFKKTRDNRIRRGLTYFWVRMTDLACKCPKIKINKYDMVKTFLFFCVLNELKAKFNEFFPGLT